MTSTIHKNNYKSLFHRMADDSGTGRESQQLATWIVTGIIVILPNFWIFNSQNTAIARGVSAIILAIMMLLFFPELRILPRKANTRLILYIFLLAMLVGLCQSDSVIMGLIGFTVLPIGSLTILAAIWTGWATTKLLDHEKICSLLIISASLSLIIALILNLIPQQVTANTRLIGFHEHSLAWAMQIGIAGIISLWRFIKYQSPIWIYGLLGLIFLGAIGYSGGRMALLATALAYTIIIILTRKISWPISKAVVLLAIALVVLLPSSTTTRLTNTPYAVESLNYRYDLATTGLKIIKKHPLGIGYGNIGRYTYSTDLPSQLLEPYHRQILIESSHNLWIDIMIGFGIIGGLIAVFVTFALLVMAWKTPKENQQLYAVGLTFLLINFLTTPASVTTLVLLGVFIGLTASKRAAG